MTNGQAVRRGGGDDTLCGGGATTTAPDTLNAATGADVLWAPYVPGDATPVGVTGGFDDACGHSSWGSAWSSGPCSYSLTSEPSTCP